MRLPDELLDDDVLDRAPSRHDRGGAVDPVSRAVVRRISDVEREDIPWLWEFRIARGKLTIIAGEPGVGKSTISQKIAADVSRGFALPGDIARDAADVVLLNAEESAGDTLRPRLEAMGADLNRVHLLDGVEGEFGVRPLGLSRAEDLQVLEAVVQERCAVLVIIDVLQAFLGAGVDMNRANEMRAVMSALKDLAERTGAAIVILCHFNKGLSSSDITRIIGSVDIVAAVRCVMVVGRDPDAPDDRGRGVIARGKSNLPGQPVAYGYTLDGGSLTWGEERADVTSAQLLAPRQVDPDGKRSAVGEAVAFLHEFLAGGPRLVSEVEAAAEQRGIMLRTLRRAAEKLPVTRAKESFSGRWRWGLPRGGHEDGQHAQDGQSLELATFAELGHLRDGGEAVDV